ncbi:hypothetical protein TWF481_011235 [Arthrobotrys musiformis]|uniref:Uncharacterized protein n=1 Tax=Arthrobotrys musiformis TaxID=47236 RepID=A0AAV9VYV1_9PEZI
MGVFASSNWLVVWLAYVLLQVSVCINAEQLRIYPWDWDFYVQQNSQAFKNILSEIGVFKLARQAHCAVGGPNDPVVLDPEIPMSLYYSTGILKIALDGFERAIDNAIVAANEGLDPTIFIQDFGFGDIESALVSERRLNKTIEVYESMITAFLESGALMDESPSTGHPTAFESDNIRALAQLIEGATLPGANLEDDVKVDPDSRPLFIDYWRAVFEEADRKSFLALAGLPLRKNTSIRRGLQS